jgi:methyl-accepting chemotaxis protein
MRVRDRLQAVLGNRDRGEHARQALDAIERAFVSVEFEPGGRITAANATFLQLTGYALQDIRGQSHRVLVDPSHAESREYRELWERLGRGEPARGQYRFVGKDQAHLWIEGSFCPVLDGTGRTIKVMAVGVDVTAAKQQAVDHQEQIAAVGKSQAVIQFDLHGNILDANANFLAVVGYSRDEIVGRHHRMFVEPAYAESAEYREFWPRLARGEVDRGQYKRIGKGGKEIWIQASYNLIRDAAGRPYKVVKYASDITAGKLREADSAGQLAAIDKSMAVIEFELDGTIRTANRNFLATVGYELEEIRGKHHRMFVEDSLARSAQYRSFWEKLGRGEFDRGQYKRIGKGGREIWIEASYNPILDASGRPVKIIKYATDITAQRKRDEALRRLVAEIRDASASVSSSAEEIARGNEDLSQRTQEQAASLEETAASINEMATGVKGNSNSAREADKLAAVAASQAEQGGGEVRQAVEAMREINAASRRIEDIIGIIDEIAFQINLLALNAAVEAARAGEQGRGFAVVATEVRSLAGRSAAAAKDIKALISDSVGKVGEGSQIVERSGKTLEQIVATVSSLAGLVSGIARATEDQGRAIEQVNLAISQMDSVTQQNAALVEEASSASQSLHTQARRLSEAVASVDVEGKQETQADADSQAVPPNGIERRGASRPWSGVSRAHA